MPIRRNPYKSPYEPPLLQTACRDCRGNDTTASGQLVGPEPRSASPATLAMPNVYPKAPVRPYRRVRSLSPTGETEEPSAARCNRRALPDRTAFLYTDSMQIGVPGQGRRSQITQIPAVFEVMRAFPSGVISERAPWPITRCLVVRQSFASALRRERSSLCQRPRRRRAGAASGSSGLSV